jgi:hypothetical protein
LSTCLTENILSGQGRGDPAPACIGTEGMTEKPGGFLKAIKEFIYGMAAHDPAHFALKTRAEMEHLFILLTWGGLVGVPLLPPYYNLRLLPYLLPRIAPWKRCLLREKSGVGGTRQFY